MTPQARKTPFWAFLSFLFIAGAIPGYASTELDEKIAAHAPKVISELSKQRDIRTIGVLSFQFQEGNGRLVSRAGRFRSETARKFETALLAALTRQQANDLRIVANADRFAAEMKAGTNHMDPRKHGNLFKIEMPVAWGYENVRVDAFVTGLARLTGDLKELEVSLMYVREGKTPSVIDAFEIPASGEILNCVGKRFRRRTVGGRLEDFASAASRQQDVRKPVRGRVQLTVLVDGQPAKHAKLDNPNEHLIAEPSEGQTVALKLERTDDADVTLGVVLRVNGVNTLYKQQASDEHCAKWVLGPKESIVVEGFRMSLDKFEKFKVLSEAASRGVEQNYGPMRGTISLTVYAEDSTTSTEAFGKPKPSHRPKVSRAAALLGAAKLPQTPPSNLLALQQALQHSANPNKERGLIESGDVRYGLVESDDRRWRPDATDSLLIYYRVSPQSMR